MASERSIYCYFAVPFIILGSLDILSNSLLIHILRKLKKLQTISYKLILIQSIADVCAGIVLIASEIALQFSMSDELYGTLVLSFRITCDAVCQFSGTMVLVVAIDRYIHMKYLTKYNTMMTDFRAAACVAMNMGSCVSMTAVNIGGVIYGYYSTSHLVMNFVAVSMYTTTFAVYFQTYNAITKRTNTINVQNESIPSKRHSRNKEFARAVALILSVLAVCYTPFVIVSSIKMFGCESCANDPVLLRAFYCTRVIVCLTPTLNAFLFIGFNKELKNFLMRRRNLDDTAASQNSPN